MSYRKKKKNLYYLKLSISNLKSTLERHFYISLTRYLKNRKYIPNKPKKGLCLNHSAYRSRLVTSLNLNVYRQFENKQPLPQRVIILIFVLEAACIYSLVAEEPGLKRGQLGLLLKKNSQCLVCRGLWQEPIRHLCSQTWPARSAHYTCQSSFVDFLLAAT